MSDKWTEGRERDWRDRDDREGDAYGRPEQRSWDRDDRMSYGRSPAGGYDGRRSQSSANVGSQDYRRENVGGYGDGRLEPRGRDADDGYSPARARYHANGFGDPGFEKDYMGPRQSELYRDQAGEHWQDISRDAGRFLHRTGERVASWFGGRGEERPDHGHRGRGPQGYKRSDERITDDVHERLTEDRWLDASQVSVSVTEGEVTLFGTVEDRNAKHRAEHIVEDISGVVHVQNNLRVHRDRSRPEAEEMSLQESVLSAQILEEGGGATHLGEMLANKKD